ncbi:MAG: peptidoglycan-associated lipoprotein Pal [Gammaproteobacteria bacterium]|jgi:peptidoglycan-associated lipoprotein|nr:peptidoglycan-associated lipoprotein [Gammaproteobacteria bacterium]RZP03523.1 MAG: peptidoglycan-associated lipoprotein Pal [Gammaproteobacteria bacterium]|tara:strand:+ start:506 stop:970 length:465 start_codon:yes stop_codon:yes gene_type:complete
MNITHKFIITLIVFFLASCSSVSMDRTNDATAISATATGAYSDTGITSNNILYFAYDKSDINSEGRTKIRTLAKLINDNNLSVRVEGHCDERGTREYNLALGEKRAKTVAELLIINGVASDKIDTVSYGEEKPASPGSNERSWSQNRRALVKTF